MNISTTVVKEQGTAVVSCVFTDEDSNSVAPDTLTWTLTDRAGTVINSREDVAVEEGDLAATTNIVLSGDDLSVLSTETKAYVERIMTIKGTYDSTYGNNLPLRYELMFYVENLTNQT